MISYLTLIETMRLSCTIFDYSAFFVESGKFLPTPPAYTAEKYIKTLPAKIIDSLLVSV